MPTKGIVTMDFQAMLQEVMPNPDSIDILFIHADSFYSMNMSMFSIGTLYVATVCQKSGYRVKCLGTAELFDMDNNELRRALKRWQPKMVGFYSVIDNIHNVKRYSDNIKRWLPKTFTVVGGPMASTIPQELAKHRSFDFIVPGEGEYVMLALANSLLRNDGKLEDVPSIVYKREQDIVSNPRAAVIEDLDSLPFPDHDLVHMTYGQHISTGRGCPYQCAFCFKEDYNNRFRCRSAQNIADEIIARLERYPVTNVYITDDVFAVDHKRVKEFCRIITEYKRAHNRDFVFFCEGRAEIIAKHPEMLEALVEAGMVRLQIGIESGVPEMLNAYGKKLRPEHVLATVELANKIKELTVAGNFIIGGPHETDETLLTSLEFAKTLLKTAPTVFECTNSALSALPGTRITNNPEKYGIKILDTDFLKGMTLTDAYCETEKLNRNDIRNWCNLFDSEVYKTMRDIICQADYKTIKRHMDWAQKWHLQTFYYVNFIGTSGLLQNYFNFLRSPRFKRLSDISPIELANYVPIRINTKCTYSRNGKSIILPGSFSKGTIMRQPLAIMLYEYAASKLTIGETAEILKKELKVNDPLFKIIGGIMLPIYKKLESLYQIAFFK